MYIGYGYNNKIYAQIHFHCIKQHDTHTHTNYTNYLIL